MSTTTTIQCPRETPWGPAQTSREIASGIWFVSTASHGGYWLHESRLRQLPAAWKGFVGFSGSYQWFEEDCDWAVVALCFPDHFSDYLIHAAFETLATLDYAKARFDEFLRSDVGRVMLKLSVLWQTNHGHLFTMGAMSSCGKGWDCSAYRIDGQERICWHQDDYPTHKPPFDRSVLAAYSVVSQSFPAPSRTLADLDPAKTLEAA